MLRNDERNSNEADSDYHEPREPDDSDAAYDAWRDEHLGQGEVHRPPTEDDEQPDIGENGAG